MSRVRRYTFDGHPIYLLGENGTEFYQQIEIQDFYALRQQCLDSSTLFEDSEFPASDQSLFFSSKSKVSYKWLRPAEISENPQFFVKGYSRFDVKQGSLNNCWFIAAAANLTLNPKLFSRVVYDDNNFDKNHYAGIFHFCFWRFGKWIDVVIDDRLPTINGKLVYNYSTDDNEFWSALLEKAYAKLHGSYQALNDGHTSEALEDFTGGITERFKLKEAPSNLYDVLVKGFEMNSMMGCSIENFGQQTIKKEKLGLFSGHAYSITKVQTVEIFHNDQIRSFNLLRLRNPEGNELEWNGPWSDTSREWQFIPVETREELGLTFDFDGEFWMSFQDFLRNFDQLEICNLSPDSLTNQQKSGWKNNWSLNEFEGQWVAGVSAGGCKDLDKFYRNPQYMIHLKNPDHDSKDGRCSVVVALMQKNRRSQQNIGLKLLTIGFRVYGIFNSELNQKPFKNGLLMKTSNFIDYREITERLSLLPGHYIIIPATVKPDEEGEFLIRVYSESESKFEEHDVTAESGDVDSKIVDDLPDLRSPTDDWLELETFFHEVADENKEIGWEELMQLLNNTRRDIPIKETTENVNNQTILEDYEKQQMYPKRNCLRVIWDFLTCNNKMHDTTINAPLINGNNIKSDKIAMQNSQLNSIQIPKSAEFSEEVCRSMIKMLDSNQSGRLGLEEFKILMFEIAKWKAVFKLYDKDKNNKLDTHEFRDAMESAGYLINAKILISLLNRYGSADKTMAMDVFIMCAVKVKTIIEQFKDSTGQKRESVNELIEQAAY
ncbi:hypothetical protein ACKWTF_009168 [Chironomus riparius]